MDEENDVALWDEYAATIKPLKKKQKHTFINNINVKTNHLCNPLLPKTKHSSLMSFDRVIFNKIKKRKIAVDAKLDLHGYFLEEAYKQLSQFIKYHYFLGNQLLLVITGKSKASDNQLTIKGAIKDWIENSELLNIVHSISDAAEIDGGKGAIYLKLRRKA